MTEPTPIDLTPFPVSERVSSAPAMPAIPDSTAFTDPQAREAAFDAEFFWDGVKLHPFSIERYGVFVSHRCAMGAPALHLAMRDGNAFYPDALRILWLCSSLPDTIAMLRRDPQAMEDAVCQWAATTIPPQRAAEAIRIALEIWNAAHENRHETRHSSIDRKAPDSGN